MSETRKLYYEDVYTKEFTAKFWNAEKEKRYEIILDQTAFIRKVADSHMIWVH